ncbi:MAG: molybdopterin-guanine dinucleotide biosynthesis protein B [Syntrophaceae bacterium]|nr:molybdopterin-guanine dinucleotide biosynthesis protein B [Syntrophaceae bacterium]
MSTTPGRGEIPILSIVGKSNTGKTTLIERLIPELVRRGWRVATIKHNRHGFQMDHEGKDSWRHRNAGAFMTVVASPHQVAVVADAPRDYTMAELRDLYVRDVDLVLAEGFKKNPHPKIEVFRPEVHAERLCGPDDHCVAVVSESPLPPSVPRFGPDDIPALCDFIERTILRGATP